MVSAAAPSSFTSGSVGSDISQRATRVYISCAGQDPEFVRVLDSALRQHGLETSLSGVATPLASADLQQTFGAIEAADELLFIICPESVASEAWRVEIAHAVRQHKRLVPVLRTDVDPRDVPAELARLNWILFRATDSFESAFDTLLQGIAIDVDWLHVHTRLLTGALEWRSAGQHSTLLLAGADLRQIRRRSWRWLKRWVGN
jgi:TIR domain